MPRPIERRLPLVAIFLSFRVLWGGGGGRVSALRHEKVAHNPGRARVKLGQHACDLQVLVGWISLFDLQGRTIVFASLHAAACAMCHVPSFDSR